MRSEERWFAGLTQLRWLELASLFEAATLCGFSFVALPLEGFGGSNLGVLVLGPLHGLAFTAFLWTVWQPGSRDLGAAQSSRDWLSAHACRSEDF